MVPTFIRLPDCLLKRVSAEAELHATSINQMIIDLLGRALSRDDQEPSESETPPPGSSIGDS